MTGKALFTATEETLNLIYMPTVTKQPNGQYFVKIGNLALTQTIINGQRFNDCTIFDGECYELVSQHDERFKPLFIALHNFKNNELKLF